MTWQPCYRRDLTDFPVEQMDSIQIHICCYSKTKTHYSVEGFELCVRGMQWDSPHHAFYSHSTISFPLKSKSWGFGPELSHVSKESHGFITLDIIKTISVTDALRGALHAKQRWSKKCVFNVAFIMLVFYFKDIYMTFYVTFSSFCATKQLK